jgi:hypothetical protein
MELLGLFFIGVPVSVIAMYFIFKFINITDEENDNRTNKRKTRR